MAVKIKDVLDIPLKCEGMRTILVQKKSVRRLDTPLK